MLRGAAEVVNHDIEESVARHIEPHPKVRFIRTARNLAITPVVAKKGYSPAIGPRGLISCNNSAEHLAGSCASANSTLISRSEFCGAKPATGASGIASKPVNVIRVPLTQVAGLRIVLQPELHFKKPWCVCTGAPQ